MSRGAITLPEAIEALTADALVGEAHPSPSDLLAYHDGELSGEARERLQTHLSWCSQCGRSVLDLAAYPDIELRNADLTRTQEEEAADWDAIRQRLETEKTEEEDRVAVPVPLPGRPPRRYQTVHVLAASLLLTVVGLSFWVFRLKREVAELAGPQANVFVADLESVTAAARRDGQEVRTTAVPDGMQSVVFLLVQDDFQPFDDHAVEIRDAEGRLVWHHRGLISPPEGGFSLAVPLTALPSDTIEIRLYGLAGQESVLLSSYRTRIEHTRPD